MEKPENNFFETNIKDFSGLIREIKNIFKNEEFKNLWGKFASGFKKPIQKPEFRDDECKSNVEIVPLHNPKPEFFCFETKEDDEKLYIWLLIFLVAVIAM